LDGGNWIGRKFSNVPAGASVSVNYDVMLGGYHSYYKIYAETSTDGISWSTVHTKSFTSAQGYNQAWVNVNQNLMSSWPGGDLYVRLYVYSSHAATDADVKFKTFDIMFQNSSATDNILYELPISVPYTFTSKGTYNPFFMVIDNLNNKGNQTVTYTLN